MAEEMTPEEMQELQAQQKGGVGTGEADIPKLFQAVGEGLGAIAQVMGQSQSITPRGKQLIQKIMADYEALIEDVNLAPGEEAQGEPAPREMPMEGEGVPVGPQMRQ